MSKSHKSRCKSSRKGGVEVSEKAMRISSPTFLLAGIMLLGLVIRSLPALYCIVGGKVIFLDLDAYYHMRRTIYALHHFPAVNNFDSYVDYPYGFYIGWPPLFDIITAAAGLLAGLGRPDALTIEIAASVMPVLMGVATIALTYFIVKDVMNEKAALLAALLMAIMPGAIFRSLFTIVDHHALEVLVSLTMYLLFLRSVSSAKKSGLSISSLRPALVYAIAAGVATACMVFSWDGAPIFISIIVAYAIAQYAYDALHKERSDYLAIAGVILSSMALIIVAPIVATGAKNPKIAFSAFSLSWFHIIYLLSIVFFFIATGVISIVLYKCKARWYTMPAIIIAMAATAATALKLALPDFLTGIELGIAYLGGSIKVMSTIAEAEPLFIVSDQLSLTVPWSFFSIAGPIAVLGLIAYLFSLKDKKLKNAELFLLVWTIIMIILGLMQKRFMNLLAVNVAIFAGFAIYGALELAGLEQYFSNLKKISASRSGSMPATLLGACAAIVLLLIPVLLSSVAMAGSPPIYALDWNEACQWVNYNTPKTSYAYSADIGTHPEYGVMCWWDYGNYILYRAERPAVANNFQTGVEDAARFFVAQDEETANAIMDKRNARYVMVDYRMGSPASGVHSGIFENMAYLAGEDPMSYHDNTATNKAMPDIKYYNTVYYKLFNLDGCGGSVNGHFIDSLKHYRLLYITAGVDPVMVFEYVKGATITGRAAPGSTVELRLKLASPYGQRTYYSQTMAGPDGQYAFVVPYPTSSSSFIKTGAAYTITSGSTSSEAEVPESAIKDGHVIQAQ
ncbi:putative membrane oligosaccharyl transferase, required for N-linked glycosylation [Methanocella conradii HZ254]|uniref:dolichyl-phosphooligosaccharide-protein glycotransferase n=1 Tax=Methanocella conradii (strain DSM 24694 / JCM 17849 / CGMCC 1.5162 / HZ254) TaxID=1041930 RepID=H8I8A0_METCZ|nr:oligosaccharyl transferase, archaeosortase A system-associated [Methanocella conradii]AFC98953.1 putative membrane oligosaccharyl transferase, required for N-linked glycosylation [Methanocella conradii HZ254]